jgi:glycosyltransferase involved in cell wall biosynthesis
MRGGEKTLEAIARLYPEAEIFTLFYDPLGISEELRRRRIRVSVLNRLPWASHIYPNLLPLYPLGCRSLDLRGYDLVISSDASIVKGVRVDPGTPHICYCHSPPRYLWNMQDVCLEHAGALRRLAARALAPWLRRWDQRAAQRVTQFVANSQNVRRRIRSYYGREATVIYPPVEPFGSPEGAAPGDHYLFVGQLVPYKRADLAVEAFSQLGRRLLVIGAGPELPRLRRRAGPNVEFLGWQPDEVVRRHLAGCRALVFPGEEDFGIVPVEAQMAGRPVIAYGAGGALETIVKGATGLFFDSPTAESLMEAIVRFEGWEGQFSPDDARRNALRFEAGVFRNAFREFVDARLGAHRAGLLSAKSALAP